MAIDIDYARYDRIRPIRWTGEALELLDQRKLPFATEYLTCRTSDEVAAAIHALAVRGAPAIGIAAAYGLVLGAQRGAPYEQSEAVLAKSRPTAVNLRWALWVLCLFSFFSATPTEFPMLLNLSYPHFFYIQSVITHARSRPAGCPGARR